MTDRVQGADDFWGEGAASGGAAAKSVPVADDYWGPVATPAPPKPGLLKRAAAGLADVLPRQEPIEPRTERRGNIRAMQPYVAGDERVQPPSGSVFDGRKVDAPSQSLIEQRGAPVSQEVFDAMRERLAGMPAAQRKQVETREDLPAWMRDLAITINPQLDQADAVAGAAKAPGWTAESRARNLTEQGVRGDIAPNIAATGTGSVAQATPLAGLDAAEYTQARAEGREQRGGSIADRAMASAGEGFQQAGAGVAASLLRAAGDHEAAAAMERAGFRARTRADGINELSTMRQNAERMGVVAPTAAGYLEDMTVGGARSAGEMIPALGAAAATTAVTKNPVQGARVAMGLMSGQVFGQEYIEGRAQGLTPGHSVARAGAMAALEYLGERYGLIPQAMRAIAGQAAKKPLEELPAFLERAVSAMERRGMFQKPMGQVVRGQLGEQVGEQITGAGQYLVDGTALGLDQPMSLSDFISNAIDTSVQTAIATGILQAGGAAVGGMRPRGAGVSRPAGTGDDGSAAAERARTDALARWDAAFNGPGSGGAPAAAPAQGAPQFTAAPAATAVEDTGLAEDAPIDTAAHAAATSPQNDRVEPTEAQKRAGNYAKGHDTTTFPGLNLSIENPAGSVRRGVDRDGTAWENTLQHHYGYIRGTKGADKDHVDVFAKPGTPAGYDGPVFVIDQVHPDTGKFDEHKVMLGYSSPDEAAAAYHANYADDWDGARAMTAMPYNEFKAWVFNGPKSEPLGDIHAASSGDRDGADATVPDAGGPAGDGTVGGGRTAGAGVGALGRPAAANAALPAGGTSARGAVPDGHRSDGALTPAGTADASTSAPATISESDAVPTAPSNQAAGQAPAAVATPTAAGAAIPGARTAEVEARGLKTAPAQRRAAAKVGGSEVLGVVSAQLGGLDPATLGDLSQKVERTRTSKTTGKQSTFSTWKNPPHAGVGPLFRKGGTQDFERVAHALAEAGYFTHEQVDADPAGMARRAYEILQAELREPGSTLREGDAGSVDAAMRQRIEAEREQFEQRRDDDADRADYAHLDAESAAEAELERRAIMEEASLTPEDLAALSDDMLIEAAGSTDTEGLMRALGFTDQEIADELAKQQARAEGDRAREAARPGQEVPGRGAPPDEARGDAPRAAEEGLTLAPQTAAELKTKTEREASAGELDQKAQVDREVDGFQLQAQTEERRTDTTGDLFGGPRPADVAGTRIQSSDSDAVRQAKADLMAGLGDLAALLSKNTRANITPEQEQQLLPILTRVFDASFRLGFLKFKDAARFVLDQIRTAIGDDVADLITLDHLQGAYIGMAGKYREQGAERPAAVAAVEALDEITQEPQRVPDAGVNVERDRPDAGAAVDDVAAPVRPAPDAARRGAGTARNPAGDRGRGRENDPRVPDGGAAAARERGDQPVDRADRQRDDARSAAGADVDPRGGGFGDRGTPVEPVAGGSALGAAGQRVLDDKLTAQAAAQSIAVQPGDLQNIRDTLPYLLPGQQEDVHKAEQRFANPTGYGMLFTNGTGTGKTFTGLGVVKRFERQGKTNTLIVVPSDKIADDWVTSGRALQLPITRLASTQDAGSGVVITTYANLGANQTLAERSWDLVVTDEAHYLTQEQSGAETSFLRTLRAITLHPDGAADRHAMLNREDLAASADLAARIAANTKILNSDDTTDAVAASVRAENAALQEQHTALLRKLDDARRAVRDDVAARQGAARPRVTFLSFTPFAYEKTVNWAQGYLFDYGDNYPYDETRTVYNQPSPREHFFITHFGYRMRVNKLTEPDSKQVDRGLLQRQFNAWLKQQGVLSGRMLDVPADYDRRFVLVDSAIGARIDAALNWVSEQARTAAKEDTGFSDLRQALADKFDYLSRRYLLEAIKATEVVPLVRQHLAMGRKVVVFHDYKKGGGFNPFDVKPTPPATGADEPTAARAASYNAAVEAFRAEFADLVAAPLWNMRSPIETFQAEFPGVMLFNGDIPPKARREAVRKFQDDASGPQVLLVQSAAGKEGISLHDTTGKHQRVQFNLGLPTQPTTAMQQEGRIYRTGQRTDAIFRYLNTGTAWERWAFASTIAQRASTAENLGSGEQARALKDSFIAAFEESGDFPAGHAGEGTGGKARDAAANNAISEYDRAKSFYWATQKRDARTKAREGTDYFATPEPLGLKMVEWADLRGGEEALEPSAGHGAIARWLPEHVGGTAIEPSLELGARMAMVFDGKLVQGTFEDHHVVNKYDAIVMNPPFGVGGKTAVEHLAKAATHLREGGRIVAIIPTGPAADKRFEKWFHEEETRPSKPLHTDARLGAIHEGDILVAGPSLNGLKLHAGHVDKHKDGRLTVRPKGEPVKSGVWLDWIERVQPGSRTASFRPAEHLHLVADMRLPAVTFERAGTSVASRVVVIDRLGKDQPAPSQVARDYSDVADIGELFDRLQDASVPARTKLEAAPPEATAKRAATPAAATAVTDAGELPIIEHVTAGGKGKTLRGVVRTDLTKVQALAIDPFTFKKDGGWFIREKHLKPKLQQRDAVDIDTAVDQHWAAEIAAHVERLQQGWSNAPPITVAQSFAELPADLQHALRSQNAEGNVRALVMPDTGQVYLIADRLPSIDEAQHALFHEVLGHFGLRLILGPVSYAQEMTRLQRANPALAAEARQWMSSFGADHIAARTATGMTDAEARTEVQLLSVEEALADRAGQGVQLTGIRRFMARLQAALRAIGLDRVANWMEARTEAETLDLLRRARQAVEGVDGIKVFTGMPVASQALLSQQDPHLREAMRKAGLAASPRLADRARNAMTRARELLARRGEFGAEFQQAVLDQFAGIRQAVTREVGALPVDQDPYIAARLANGGTSAVMRGLLLHGQARWAANHQHLEKVDGTKGLLEILAPLGQDLNNWFGWMIGNRAARLMTEGKENNFTDDEIKALQALGAGKLDLFRRVAAEYAGFKRSVLDVAQSAGLIDAEGRQVWDRADYIPFYREIDEKAVFSATGRRGLAGQSSGVRTLRGGAAALNDPMENLLMNFSRLIDASLKNNALRRTVATLSGKDIIERVGYDMKPAIVPVGQVKKVLAGAGMPDAMMAAIPKQVFEGMAKMWAIQAPAAPDVVRVMVDGKPVFYKVHDPLLLRAVTSFVPFDFPGLGVMRAFKRVLTATVTATPEFMLRNFIRDSVASAIITRDGFNPAKSITGIGKAWAESGAAEAMLFSGASFQSGNVNAADPTGTANAIRRALRKKGLSASAAEGYLGTVVDFSLSGWERYRRAGEAIENANREAVYGAAMASGKGATAAAYESKDLMDFSLRGSSPLYQVLADVLPFFNARVQGLYRLGRSDPQRLVRYGLLMTAASIALLMANAGDDGYEALPDWDKDANWHLWIGGEHFRIPKPFELGVAFATIPERITRYAMGRDPGSKTAGRIWAALRDQLAFDPVPQMIRPALNVWANQDTFMDRPIEGMSDEGKLPSQRYSATTSDTARELSQALAPMSDSLGLGPKRIEYLVRGYLGTAGMYALSLSDMAVRAASDAPARPTMRPDDLPVVRAFYQVDPARSTVWESDVFTMREELARIYASVRALQREGDAEGAAAMLERNRDKLQAYGAVQGAAKGLTALSKQRDAIYRDRTMTPDQKRAAVDDLTRRRAEIAKATMQRPEVEAIR